MLLVLFTKCFWVWLSVKQLSVGISEEQEAGRGRMLAGGGAGQGTMAELQSAGQIPVGA